MAPQATILRRMSIIIPLILGAGLLVYFKDKTVGSAILFGGVLSVAGGILLYRKMRRGNKAGADRTASTFLILLGSIVLLVGAITIFVLGQTKGIFDLIAGAAFLSLGLLRRKGSYEK